MERSLATWLGPCSRSVGSREMRNEWPPLTWLGLGLGHKGKGEGEGKSKG